MTKSAFFLFFCLITSFGPAFADGGQIRQVYLVQNSGWMEPYYLDRRSQFIKLAESLVGASRLEGVDITIASFNQDGQIPGKRSPEVRFSGPYSPEGVADALAKIELPRRPGGRYADADFLGALKSTIGDLLGGQEGVIWMLSNNKNSPNNSQDIAANTRGFYDLLRNSEFISRIVAFPLRMPVAGPNFSEKGFIVYGIAYGNTAARALDVITGQGAPLRDLFTDPPIFLKPLEPQTLELELSGQKIADGAEVSMENGIVVISGLSAETGSTINFTGRVRNIAYPKKIVSARISASWDGNNADQVVAAQQPLVENIAAGATSDPLPFSLIVPPAPRPLGLAGWTTSEVTVDGQLSVKLNQLAFDLDDGFIDKAAAVFGGEMMGEGQRSFVEQQLPSIFFDFRTVNESVTRVPIRMIFHFSLWPLYVAAAGLVLLVLALIALIALFTRARAQVVNIGGSQHKLFLKPGQTIVVAGGDGRRHRVKGRLLGAPSVARLP
jgi:hypothetical protein